MPTYTGYSNEAKFSSALCKRLKTIGCMVTRIETGTTRCGVPDIHIVVNGEERWIETKNMHCYWTGSAMIQWRPGQQTWALEYLAHKGKPSLTVVAFKNKIICVPMVKHFENCIVTSKDVSNEWYSVKEILL